MADPEGRQLGPYKLEASIGAGGMGEVFRATDTRLHRTVAIKVLPEKEVADPERKRRLLQEARAASALNHPNIVTLHDIASDGGIDYLVMEYVAGKPLDNVIQSRGLPLAEAVGYATQIAAALAAAHAAGIVHRDIKPGNVIVVGESQVKVLDFGLAKLQHTEDAETVTAAGIIMGTVAYMSPEQASGKQVDHRSDIFSLGVVLYELITGNRPFSRNSHAETMSAIINDACPPLDGLPPRLGEIIDKALEKDPKERYQSAADFSVDLRRLLKHAPAASAPAPSTPSVAQRKPWLWIAAALLILAVGGSVIWMGRGGVAAPNDLVNDAQFTRLTDFPGDEGSAVISPDGKFVVFMSDRDGPQDLWLTQVGTGQFQNLTKGAVVPANGTNWEAGFSADGAEIWQKGPPPPNQRMRRIALVGGSWRPFLGDRTVNVTWSPDGMQIAYFTNTDGDPIFVANKDGDGSNARQIFVDRPGVHNHFPKWSPDGKWLYFVHGNVATLEMDLWRIAPSGGQPESLTNIRRNIAYPTPLNAQTVLYTASDQDGSGPWLWAFDLTQRVSRRIGFGLERYTSIGATAEGRRLVASVANPVANLWSIPILDKPAEETDIKAYSVPNVRALLPRFGANALFYLSSQGGDDGLWRLDKDGHATEVWKGAQALLAPAAISTEGRVAVVVRKDGRQTLHIISSEGSDMQSLAQAIDVRGTAS